MKKNILSIILFLFSNTSLQSHVDDYKNVKFLEYELFRNDKSIGYHKYNFIREDDTLSVKSEVKFKITKLGVDLYKYFAESEEIYKNNKFFQFNSKYSR